MGDAFWEERALDRAAGGSWGVGEGLGRGSTQFWVVLSFRPCCPWAVCASSLTAASTRRPTAATSWGSAPTCRSLPTCWPQVRAASVWAEPGSEVKPRDWTSAAGLRAMPAGLRREDPRCRTSFPHDIGF